jgi:ATP-dependent Clp endopeptidase proteolytic subunit ClpP
MYFNYTINDLSDEPIMLIDKHIGFDEVDGMGIMGDQFAKELLALDEMGKKRIQVWINSVGGNIMDGMSIYNAILRTKTKVDTYNVGVAASAAGWIFQAGRKRYMNDYAIMMIHDPYGGDADDEALKAFKNSCVTMIASRCGKSPEEISDMMAKETWLLADECKDMGMCDEITGSAEMNKKRLYGMEMQDAWKVANKILNRSLNNNSKMIKVANKLGLNEAANEDAVVAAIEDIQNKATEYKNQLEEVNKAMELATAENEALKAKVEEAEAKEKEAQEAKAETEASALVDEYKDRIGDVEAVVNKWKNMAKKDLAGTKELLDAIPLNKTAPKGQETSTPAPVYNMAAIMNKKDN